MGGVGRPMREIVTRMPEPPITTHPRNTSLEEERRELLTSVMGVLDGNSPDPDEMAACSYLLKHLNSISPAGCGTAPCRLRYDG